MILKCEGKCGKDIEIFSKTEACQICQECWDCCRKSSGEHLATLKIGDAFEYEGEKYIAFALTPDPAEVYCLNVRTHELEEIYEGEKVFPIYVWGLDLDPELHPKRGKDLEVL